MRFTRDLWNRLMDFNNIWQRGIPEHNGVSRVPGFLWPRSRSQNGLSIYVTMKAASEGISLVLTRASCY